jgi:cephalosporin-C deacetylase-like acetyl esterase
MTDSQLYLQYRPNEKGIKLDAQTALDYILSHEKLEKTKIWLYGQSIGGAVSIFLASQNSQRVGPVPRTSLRLL